MDEKIKLTTYKDHIDTFGRKKNANMYAILSKLTSVFGENQLMLLEHNATNQGWHCSACKMYGMIKNYNYGLETGDWKNLPYESD